MDPQPAYSNDVNSQRSPFNRVTTFSKLIALFLLVALPVAGFFFGIYYEQQINPTQTQTVFTSPTKPASTSATPAVKATLVDYKDTDTKFSLSYPSGWVVTQKTRNSLGLVFHVTVDPAKQTSTSLSVYKNPAGFGFCEGDTTAKTQSVTISGVLVQRTDCTGFVGLSYTVGADKFFVSGTYTTASEKDTLNKVIDSYQILK